ncbi:hypothetical protein T484DRAFT_1956346 [Baffinella frigidus]|nr:hypothetical protein T484DRAFT_1956346 [Cryptophyta sp. CCMP2293]
MGGVQHEDSGIMTLGSLDAKQIMEYAVYIGIEPTKEPHLLWIAEEGMQAPVPEGFTEHQDANGEVYFYKVDTKESMWEHPMDQHYMGLVKQFRGSPATPNEEERRFDKEKVKRVNDAAVAAEAAPDEDNDAIINMAPPQSGFLSRLKALA